MDEAEGKQRQEEKGRMRGDLQQIIDQTIGGIGWFSTPDELRDVVVALAEEAKELDATSREALKIMAARELREANVSDPRRLLNAAFEDDAAFSDEQ